MNSLNFLIIVLKKLYLNKNNIHNNNLDVWPGQQTEYNIIRI